MPNPLRKSPRHPVIALGLDAADPVLIEKWMAEGRLPNLARLRAGGAYGRLHSTVALNGQVTEAFATEPLWVDFATGRKPTRTGAWDSMVFDARRYSIRNLDDGSPAFDRTAPFYALGEDCRVAVLDLPMTRLSADVHGAQVLGWGGHFPHTRSESAPPELLGELIARHGANPVLYQDDGIWWDARYVRWLDRALTDSVAARTRLMRDLLARESWDLFLGVYSEPHTAGHDVYVYSQADHPLNAVVPNPVGLDLLRRTYEQVDAGIGEIVANAPADASIVCFSLHGMGPNYSDQLSSVMLSEALYRMSFPGQAALAPGIVGAPLPPPVTRPHRGAWITELWTRHVAVGPARRLMRAYLPRRMLRHDCNGLASPFTQDARATSMSWHPSMWYRPLWPTMKAFALPGFTKGRIRINLRGRDRDGIVDAADYAAVCNDIERLLRRLRDARTGEPIVKNVLRTRRYPLDADPLLPDFDLDVLWHERVTDVIDSPDVGRIGPIPHFRAGGHWNRGFVLASGPGIAPGSALRTGEAVDLAPTLLALMGRDGPADFDGRSLLPADTAPPVGASAPHRTDATLT